MAETWTQIGRVPEALFRKALAAHRGAVIKTGRLDPAADEQRLRAAIAVVNEALQEPTPRLFDGIPMPKKPKAFEPEHYELTP